MKDHFKFRKGVLPHIFATEILATALWYFLGKWMGLTITETFIIAIYMNVVAFGLIAMDILGVNKIGIKDRC